MTSSPPPKPAARNVAVWLTVSNVVLAVVLGVLAVKWRSETREAEQARAREAVTSVARALAQVVSGDMARVDAVLKSAVAAFERAAERGPVPGAPLAMEMADLRAGVPDADVLLVSDAQGNVRIGLPNGAPAANLADRDFFIAARSAPAATLPVVSRPWLGRVSGKWGVSIARPLRGPGGEFAGFRAEAKPPRVGSRRT